jgi:hypothetical protein
MMLPRRVLVRVETLERRLRPAVPRVVSGEARALLDAVLVGLDEPRPEWRDDPHERP